MVKSRSHKRHKASKDSIGDIDRISDLPDPLISDILSLLSTKAAVRTSVLSTRWKLLWTTINKIDFRIGETYAAAPESRSMWQSKYKFFVKKVLPQLNPLSIQSFRLTFFYRGYRLYRNYQYLDYQYRDTPSLNNDWISEAFERTSGSGEMVLNLVLVGHMMLPLSHITYCNLAVLKLKGDIHFYVPAKASVCFPRLHTLHLNRVEFVIDSDSSVSFPNLKKLHLKNIKFASENFFPMENFSTLRQAKIILYHIKNDEEQCSSLVKLIGCLSNVKFLSGSNHFLKAIRIASGKSVLRFHSLVRLELKAHSCTDLTVVINNLLESMENLEHIVIKGRCCSCTRRSWWTEPLNVPMCLMTRLTTVSFSFKHVCSECRDSLELLRYLIKNGEVLQLLSISNLRLAIPEFEMLREKISMFPRGSRTCQVAFK